QPRAANHPIIRTEPRRWQTLRPARRLQRRLASRLARFGWLAKQLEPFVVRDRRAHLVGATAHRTKDVGVPSVLHYECEQRRKKQAFTAVESVSWGCFEGSPFAKAAAPCVELRPILARSPHTP